MKKSQDVQNFKNTSLNNSQIKEEFLKQNIFQNKWKWKGYLSNLWNAVKSVLREKFTAWDACIRKESSKINNLSFHIRN